MSGQTLIIIVSDDLADIHSDVPLQFDGIVLLIPARVLDGRPGIDGKRGVEQPWEPYLEERLIQILKSLEPEVVRIAVHRKCFEIEDAYEFRFVVGERSLRKKTGIADIQVLGFAHEVDIVALWTALYTHRPKIKKLRLDDQSLQPVVEALIPKLKDAFQEWHTADLTATLADCRSAVLGCAGSIVQTLRWQKENLEAGNASDQPDAEKILANLESAEGKLKEYVDLFRLNDPVVFDRAKPSLDALAQVLSERSKISTRITSIEAVRQELIEFRRWEERLKAGFSDVNAKFSN